VNFDKRKISTVSPWIWSGIAVLEPFLPSIAQRLLNLDMEALLATLKMITINDIQIKWLYCEYWQKKDPHCVTLDLVLNCSLGALLTLHSLEVAQSRFGSPVGRRQNHHYIQHWDKMFVLWISTKERFPPWICSGIVVLEHFLSSIA